MANLMMNMHKYDETKYAVLTKKDGGCLNCDVNCDKPEISDDLRVQMGKMGAKTFQNKVSSFKITKDRELIES